MPYPGNTARCVFDFVLPNGSHGYVVMHARSFDGLDLSDADIETIGIQLADWWSNSNFQSATNVPVRTWTNINITLSTITVTSLAPVTPAQSVISVNLAGSGSGAPLPNESAVVVTLYTGIVGRSYRGRNFWPMVGTTAMQANGTMLDVTLAGIQTTFDALIDQWALTGDYVVAVNSETLGEVNQVVSATVRDTLHHQRRRNS